MAHTRKRKLATTRKTRKSGRKAGATIAASGLAVSLLVGPAHAYAPAQAVELDRELQVTSEEGVVSLQNDDGQLTQVAVARKKAGRKKATKKQR